MARNGSKSLKSTTSLQALIQLSPDFQDLSSPWNHSKNTQNDLFLPQTSINTPQMHPKTTFISGKYRPKWPEMVRFSRRSCDQVPDSAKWLEGLFWGQKSELTVKISQNEGHFTFSTFSKLFKSRMPDTELKNSKSRFFRFSRRSCD